MQIVQGIAAAKVLALVAQAGIPDRLAEGPRTVDELAAATDLDASALARVLRALETLDVFAREPDGRWRNAALGQVLISNVPGSIRDYVVYALHDGNWQAWQHASFALRTGNPAFAEANGGVDFWQYLDSHPPIAGAFHRAMAALAGPSLRALPGALGVDRFTRLADLGGGTGTVLAHLLDAAPHATGILYDVDSAIEEARTFFAAHGLSDRVVLERGDLFARVPAGADAYLLKNVLHDHVDARCSRLLDLLRATIEPTARLFIVDAVIPERAAPHPAKWIDLHMMVAVGGRERDEAEWRTLLGRSGFAVERIAPLPGSNAVIEARPI